VAAGSVSTTARNATALAAAASETATTTAG
jgi:hypothetical protein